MTQPQDPLRPERTVPCPHCAGSGSVTIAAEVSTVEVYYFGCWEQSGHYWRAPGGFKGGREIEAQLPEPLRGNGMGGGMDSKWCPGSAPGAPHKKTRAEVEGEAALHHVDGWTILAWWDRSVDHRGASNSNLVARGLHSWATMLEIGKAQFPSVMKRQRVHMVLVVAPPPRDPA